MRDGYRNTPPANTNVSGDHSMPTRNTAGRGQSVVTEHTTVFLHDTCCGGVTVFRRIQQYSCELAHVHGSLGLARGEHMQHDFHASLAEEVQHPFCERGW
jgi:hypothetical protein